MLSWQNILNSRQIAADTEEKLANQGKVLRKGISHIYLYISNKWKPYHGAINSRPRNLRIPLEKYFQFQRSCKQTTSWSEEQRFISPFYLKLCIQFWKYFHRMVLESVGTGYYKKKKRGVRIFGQSFWLGCLGVFNFCCRGSFFLD